MPTRRALGRLGVAACGLLALGACGDPLEHPLTEAFADPAARDRIAAVAASQGWRVGEMRADQIPFEHHAGDGYGGHGGEMIVLVGPTSIELAGYYCRNQWCEKPLRAREAIELWVMPRHYPDGANTLALQALRVPDRIYEDDRLRVYALVSRVWPGGTFDRSFTVASSETSSLGAAGRDLPVSWTDWKTDVAAALRPAPR